jgi:hypothetical protein
MTSLKNELILNFFIGGIILSMITFAVKYVSPEIGSIIWAAPVLLLPTVILLWLNNVNNTTIANFIYCGIPNIILIILWQLTFIFLLTKMNYHMVLSVILSLIIWIIVAILFYRYDIYKFIKIKII